LAYPSFDPSLRMLFGVSLLTLIILQDLNIRFSLCSQSNRIAGLSDKKIAVLPNPSFEVGPRTWVVPFELRATPSLLLPHSRGRCGANST